MRTLLTTHTSGLPRLPDDFPGGERQGVRYYQAQNLESPQIPEAFAPAPSVIRMGWLPQTLDGSAVSKISAEQ